MTVLEFCILLVVAGLCGSLAQALVGYNHGGCLVSVALGFIGALLGTWLSRVMQLPELLNVTVGAQPFPVVWSIIGAALFVALLGMLRRRSH